MKRHLFLTGDIGAGKSTAIAAALGPALAHMGGFLTRRHAGPGGQPGFFTLETPDGRQQATFLDLTGGVPRVFPEVFATLGAAALQGEALVLDEIGGIELLEPVFWTALKEVLGSDVPILGVVKGPSPRDSLAAALGLGEAYARQAQALWALLTRDEHTLVYSCRKYDDAAPALARQWVEEYCL